MRLEMWALPARVKKTEHSCSTGLPARLWAISTCLHKGQPLTSQPTRHLQNSADSPWVSVKAEDSQPES